MIHFFKTPLHFCLLIPCYNDVAGLLQALRSVQYAAENVAVIVVDDGSAEEVRMDVLKSLLPHLPNIHVIRLQQNSGITTALNTGLQWILENTSAPYIARLDCRDTCAPDRFYKQLTFLNTHAAVGLLGSWCTFSNQSGSQKYTYTTPLTHAALLKAMHLRNVFIHPAVMFRTALLAQTGLYPHHFPHAEDYALFWRFMQVSEGAVLNETLTACALVPGGISQANRRAQLQSRKKVVQHFGTDGYLKKQSLLKLNILLIMPNSLLLRLKTRLRFGIVF